MKLFKVGAKIREIRKEKAITQEELAQKANISRVTIGKLERGQMGAVSIKTLDIILDSLGYEIAINKKLKNSFGIPSLDEINQVEL